MSRPEGASEKGQGGWWEPVSPPPQAAGREPGSATPQQHPGYDAWSPQEYPQQPEQQPGGEPAYPPYQQPPHPTQEYSQPLYPPPPPYSPPQYPSQQYPPPGGWGPQDAYGNRIPPNSGKRNLVVVLSVAAIVVAVGVVAVLGLTHRGNRSNSTSPASVATGAATSTDQGSPMQTTGPDETQAPLQPTIAGWQAVTVGTSAAAVDVPPDWQVGSAAAAVDPSAAAIEGVGACAGQDKSFRSLVAPVNTASSDPNVILAATLGMLDYGGLGPQVSMDPPHSTTDGSFQDYKATIGLTQRTVGTFCDPPRAVVHLLVKTGAGGTTVVAVEGDQQCNDAVDESDLDKIAMTVRTQN